MYWPEVQMLMLCMFCYGHCQNSSPDFMNLKSRTTQINKLIRQQYCTTLETMRGVNFDDWSFSNKSPLLDFPIDTEERNYVRKVYNVTFSRVMPTPFKSTPVLVAISSSTLDEILDLNVCDCVKSQRFLAMVSGDGDHDVSPPNTLNLAHHYGGHQFGYWAGQLGDGRAILLGSYVNKRGEYWEAQLKGSGKTPYSRSGDGRAVLRSSIREFLASEAMYSLGIRTSRAASLVVSDDTAWRDQFYNGNMRQEPTAVVLRLAPSWFRIGSLEILHHNKEFDLLKQTVDFVINQYYPNLTSLTPSQQYMTFFATVVRETAEMIAQWQSVGFVHGVCNTDNFSLLSMTIDYGPFGFMDQYDPDFVPNTSDDEGMYRYQYQPSVGYYNLLKLSETIEPLLTNTSNQEELHKGLMLYASEFNDAFLCLMSRKLGLLRIGNQQHVEQLVMGLLNIMADQKADFTMTFRELSETTVVELMVTDKFPGHYWALPRLLAHSAWRGWLLHYQSLSVSLATEGSSTERIASYTEGMRQERMQAINPRYILRNWMAENAIRRAEKTGDYSIVHKLQRVVRNPFTIQSEAEESGYAKPPPTWASKLRVSCSS